MLENGLIGGEISIKVEPNYDYESQDEEKKTEDGFEFVNNAVLFTPENVECFIKSEPRDFTGDYEQRRFLNVLQNEDFEKKIVNEILHRVNSREFSSGVEYECFHCGHRTPDINKLRVHVEIRHLNLGGLPSPRTPYQRRRVPPGKRWRNKCSICGEKFEKRSGLRDHLEDRHDGKMAFDCSFCSYNALTHADLKSHVRFRHTKEQPFKCGYCSYSSASSGAVRRHLSVMHPHDPVKMSGKKTCTSVPHEKRIIKCELCDYEANFPSVMNQHVMVKHSQIRPYPCSYCTFQTTSPGRLRNHILARHTDERPFQCATCGKCFFEKKRLQRHIEVKHLDKKFTCEFCGFAAGYRDNLKRHIISRHTDEKRYSCDHCSYKTAQSGNLKRHVLLKHSLERPYTCNICWYVTENPEVLKRHHQTKHTGGKDIRSCPHCEYSTNHKSYLRRHIMSRHVTNKPHKCTLCNYSTSLSYTLKMHIRNKHTNERPYSCSFCEFRASSEQRVKYHINAKHTGKTKSLQKCEVCEFSTELKKTLREHIKEVHFKKKTIPCPECDFVANTKASFASHRKCHTLKDNLSCTFCKYTTKSSKVLQNHMWRKHSNEYIVTCSDNVYERIKSEEEEIKEEGNEISNSLCSLDSFNFNGSTLPVCNILDEGNVTNGNQNL